ncbi:MAG: phage tail protein [Phascolarctobacterium sp.]
MALVGAAVVGVTALSLAKVNSIALNSMKANSVALQAYQFADAEAQLVRATDYSSLASKAKSDIPNSNGFQSEVTLSDETDYSETIKQKTATVKIYRSGESTPRVSLDVTRLNKELKSTGVPIGTVITWPGSSAPTEGGTWLLCNGQSCAAYPALKAIVGDNVPNYTGAFLRAYGTRTTYYKGDIVHTSGALGALQQDAMIELPSSTFYAALGKIGADYASESQQNVFSCSGAFSYVSTYNTAMKTGNSDNWGRKYKLDFSNVYPTANEIRPINVAVNYYIKAE